MTRAETSTGVPQNALVAVKLRSEVAESLTGVLQSGHEPSGPFSRHSGVIALGCAGVHFQMTQASAVTMARNRTREGGGDLLIEAAWQNARALL